MAVQFFEIYFQQYLSSRYTRLQLVWLYLSVLRQIIIGPSLLHDAYTRLRHTTVKPARYQPRASRAHHTRPRTRPTSTTVHRTATSHACLSRTEPPPAAAEPPVLLLL